MDLFWGSFHPARQGKDEELHRVVWRISPVSSATKSWIMKMVWIIDWTMNTNQLYPILLHDSQENRGKKGKDIINWRSYPGERHFLTYLKVKQLFKTVSRTPCLISSGPHESCSERGDGHASFELCLQRLAGPIRQPVWVWCQRQSFPSFFFLSCCPPSLSHQNVAATRDSVLFRNAHVAWKQSKWNFSFHLFALHRFFKLEFCLLVFRLVTRLHSLHTTLTIVSWSALILSLTLVRFNSVILFASLVARVALRHREGAARA